MSQETLKVPCDCYYDRALLFPCDFSLSANQIFDYFSSEHMVTIFIYHIHTSIYNTCVKCGRYINKYNSDFKKKEVDRIV